MSNRQIEAILKISAKMGDMRALRTLQRELSNIDSRAKKFNRTNSLMAKGLAATTAVIAPSVAAFAGYRVLKNYAAAERQITRIGITADATAEQTAHAMAKLRDAAMVLHMPFEQVVEGMDAMVSSGKNMEEAFALLPAVGKAAQASGADFRDMATTADAISGSFGILSSKMEGAFDILAYGGKVGKFELRDMAAELPSLAPAFVALGYKGEAGLKKLVAMLQGVRMETGTSGEAATSLMDVLTKMQSETMQSNFKRFGKNLRQDMAKAKEGGEDLFDAFLRLSKEAVNGELSRLPELFTDKQMLIGMRALINQTGKVKEWESAMAGAAGTVSKDFKRTALDIEASLTDVENSFQGILGSAAASFKAAGGVGALNQLSADMQKAAAINIALQNKNLTELEKFVWRWKNIGFLVDDAGEDSMAWQGGYRSPQQRAQIDAYGQYARERNASAAAAAGFVDGVVLPRGAVDKNGMPISGPIPTYRDGSRRTPKGGGDSNIPIPTARPSDVERARDEVNAIIDRKYRAEAERIAARATNRGVMATENARRKRAHAGANPMDGGGDPNYSEFLRAASGDGIAEAGDKAGQSITDAAKAINTSAEQGGRTFATMVEGIGARIGREAATAFNANVRLPAAGAVRADTGRSQAGHYTGGPK